MSVCDGFPSDRLPLGGLLQRLRNSVVASRGANAAFLGDRGRPANTKLLHPVGQRRSLHPQARGCATLSADHPVARFQSTKDMIPLDLGETIHRGIGPFVRLERLLPAICPPHSPLRHANPCAFYHVLQFTVFSAP